MNKLSVAMLLGIAALMVMGCTKPESEPGSEQGDWVDLGLPSGLLWATRNVGATSPEDYGDYFAWGETTPKEVYNWSTYRYCISFSNNLTKYCNNSDYGDNGFADNLTILESSDDAATANYGGRTPTKEDWEELINNTTCKWARQKGVSGCRFTSSNGNSLFLPAAGIRSDSSVHFDGSFCQYWSSSLYDEFPGYAWYFDYDMGMGGSYRYGGFSVRAVR